MKILVLGSSGQIGSHLCDFLRKRNQEVIEFDIVRNSEEDLRINQNKTLDEAMSVCDFVYFLAFDVGGSRYLKKYQHSFEFTHNNIQLMANTFESIKKHSKPFIFASSQMSNMDYSPYGNQKRLGEHYTKLLNGLVVKFWNVYGVEKDLDKSHVITDFILKAKNTGKIDMITDGSEERQFLYAEDCCEALEIVRHNYNNIDRNESLDIAYHKWNSIVDIAKEITKSIPAEIIPGQHTDVVQMCKKNEPNPYVLKFWKPKITLEEGIKIMCDYYLNSNNPTTTNQI
jgi:nucleoside-diphosphate-sugar epimerase